MEEVGVPADGVGRRIQEGLVGLFPEALPSRKACRKALDGGRVKVVRQGEELAATTALIFQPGDRVRLLPVDSVAAAWEGEVRIGFEDGVHAVVWKPAGWVTSGVQRPSLRDALVAALGASAEPDALPRPEPVHRLDRGTAGWVLVAKSARAATVLAGQIAPGGGAEKAYCAVCRGVPPTRFLCAVALGGREAVTEGTRWAAGPLGGGLAAAVWVQLRTGRTHQIRRHLAGLGHPVVGDAAYGGGAGSVLLACTDLAYSDPTTGQRRSLQAPLPKRFRRIPWIRHAVKD